MAANCSEHVQAKAMSFTCEPVEYRPGVRDPDVFPEPMELSVLFPLQQCVRRHFPYSFRTYGIKWQHLLIGNPFFSFEN